MNFFESANALFSYGIGTLLFFACAYAVADLTTDLFDWPGWVVPVVIIGLLAVWLLGTHGWNLLTSAFGGSWDYGNDLRVSSMGPDDAWFILKVKFWAAIVGTALGYFGLGKLRHEW